NIIGVGHESTTKIIENVIDYSYGAKITGAGGGGAVVIIPRKKEMVIEKLESMGIKYYEVKIDNEGVSFIK
ncbi:MAG: mevalonate kinase, partial [Thermoplasmata archaeon]